jgi:hypothetical protein
MGLFDFYNDTYKQDIGHACKYLNSFVAANFQYYRTDSKKKFNEYQNRLVGKIISVHEDIFAKKIT